MTEPKLLQHLLLWGQGTEGVEFGFEAGQGGEEGHGGGQLVDVKMGIKKSRWVGLVLTQISNALLAVWLEGRFCAVTYPMWCFSSEVSRLKRGFALLRESRKKIWVRTSWVGRDFLVLIGTE